MAAEVSRRFWIAQSTVAEFAERVGIRRLVRPGLPPLYHEGDVADIEAQQRIEGEGVRVPAAVQP